MALTPEQLQPALEAFFAALPKGTTATVITTVPRVGFADTDAGAVSAIVLAENNEDVMRFEQVINRGIKSFQDEPGMVASFIRAGDPAA